MATKFKSITKAIKRGHLRIAYKTIQQGFKDIGNPILGSNLVPTGIKIPSHLERRTSTNKRKWIPYN